MVFLLAGCKDDNVTDEKIEFHLVAMKDGNYGVINQEGDVILPFSYKELSNPSKDGLMVHRYQNGLYELINVEGETIMSSFSNLIPIYDQSLKGYTHPTPYAFYGVKNDESSLYDSKGQHFMDIDSPVYVFEQRVFSTKGFFELNDVSKEFVNEYDSIYQFSDEAYFTSKESTIFVLNRDGEVTYDYPDSTMVMMQNFIKITTISYIALFDYDGQMITSHTSLKNAYQIQDTDYILINYRDKFGVIDIEGNEIIPNDYVEIEYKNDLFVAKKHMGFDFYSYDVYHKDTLQNTFEIFSYQRTYGYGNENYVVYDSIRRGYYYYHENEEIGGPFKGAAPFNDKGYAAIVTNDDYMAIIDDHFEIIDSTYRLYMPFGNHFIVKSKSGVNLYQWGILDENLDLVVPTRYELLFDLLLPNTNMIALQEEETMITHFYVIDEEGVLHNLYDLSFDDAVSYFNEHVNFNYEDDYIDNLIKIRTANLPQGYEIIDIVAKDYMIATLDGKYGVIDDTYEIIIPFEYDLIIGNQGID
jgi:hypothetical protein